MLKNCLFKFYLRLLVLINSNNYTMKTKFNGFLTLFLALVVQISFAQQKTISGVVTDASGTLPGVSVIVKGSTTGTETDFDGKYSIKAKPNDVLQFRYLGYKLVEKTVGTSNTINVTLQEDDNVLEEVVITGYTTIQSKKSAVAATSLKAETIEDRPNASIVQTLTGQVPGLDISTSSGQPGANSLVQLRGVNSINGNTEPLFIMDGIPINEDNFRSLNPNEIESVNILKDAGATAIYGSRGANGVIVITTRKGKKGTPLRVNYTSIYSLSTLQGNRYDLMNSQQLATLERLQGVGFGAGNNLGTFGNAYIQNPNFIPDPNNPATGSTSPLTDAQIAALPNTNWEDVFLRTAQTQNHTLTLSSGGENMSQFTSIGYFEQAGILRDSNLKRFNLRSNVNGSSGKFSYGTNISLNYSKNDQPTSIGTTGVNQNPFFGANLGLPYITPEQQPTSRELAGNFFLYFGPFYTTDKLSTSVALDEEIKIIASTNASYEFTDGLVASFVAGIDYENIVTLDSQEPISRNQLRFNPEVDGFQDQFTDRRLALNVTSSLTYNKEFGKHAFNFGLYTEYFKAHRRFFGFEQTGLNVKTFSPGDGAGFIPDNGNDDFFRDNVFATKRDAGLFSYFGSIDYDFDSRFGFSAVVRRDASYRFAETNRWGTFGSVAARWNVSEESFMEGSVFDNLKLRASYGTTGNQRINGGNYWTAPDLALSLFSTGVGYAGLETIQLAQIGNDALKWETVAQTNVGIDFGLWNSRLRGSFDYYFKKTTDLFQDLPVSAVNGVTRLDSNTGFLVNRGFDFDLRYDLIRNNNLKLTLNFIGNINDNYLGDLPADVDLVTGETQILGIGRNGGRLGERFEIRYAGVNPANGNLLFLDRDGNLTENPNADTDRVWTGKNVTPEAQGSFGFNLDYKGFFLQTQFNYTIGVDFSDIDYARYIDPENIGQYVLSNDLSRAWTPTNRITDIPSLNLTNDNFASDRFVVNRDFIRLRFVTAGYNFPKSTLEKTGISSLRLFTNAENLFTLTQFRGFDASSRTTGLAYPTPRIVSFGVEIGL